MASWVCISAKPQCWLLNEIGLKVQRKLPMICAGLKLSAEGAGAEYLEAFETALGSFADRDQKEQMVGFSD